MNMKRKPYRPTEVKLSRSEVMWNVIPLGILFAIIVGITLYMIGLSLMFDPSTVSTGG